MTGALCAAQASLDPAEPFWQAFVEAINDLNAADLDDRATIRSIHARMDQAEIGLRDKSIEAGVVDETAAYDQAIKREHNEDPQDSEDVADSLTGTG